MAKYFTKCLTISIIILFLITGFSTVIDAKTNDVFVTKSFDNKNNYRDQNSGFLLCMTYYDFFIARHSGVACFVKYELIDYDTGKIIEKATSLFGIHLFKFLLTGHNYIVKVTTPKGCEDAVVKNLHSFYWLPIEVLVIE